jgi:hypothetical protein
MNFIRNALNCLNEENERFSNSLFLSFYLIFFSSSLTLCFYLNVIYLIVLMKKTKCSQILFLYFYLFLSSLAFSLYFNVRQ